MLRDTYARNADSANFRLFCPDETNSNRLGAVFEVENHCFVGKTLPIDDPANPYGPCGKKCRRRRKRARVASTIKATPRSPHTTNQNTHPS